MPFQKRITALLLCLCLLLSGCGSPSAVLDHLQNGPAPITGLVLRKSAAPFITKETFSAQNAQTAVTFFEAANAGEEKSLLAACAADETITALGCQLSADSDAAALLQIAREAEKPIIFWGEDPGDALLDSYNQCWYVCSREQEAGELMGQMVCNAFDTHIIADQNQNKLVDYVLISDEDVSIKGQSTLDVLEHAGYFSDPVKLPAAEEPQEDILADFDEGASEESEETDEEAVSSNAEADSMQPDSAEPVEDDSAAFKQNPFTLTGSLLDNGCYVELFICPSSHDAEDVVRAIESRVSIQTETAPSEEEENSEESDVEETEDETTKPIVPRLQYGIICGEETPEAVSMLQRGVILGYVAYDDTAAAQTILTLACNATKRISPSEGLSYPIEAHRRIYIPHIAYQLPAAP